MSETISVIARSLSILLERVWVNYLMVIVALFIPEQTLSKYNILSSTLFVALMTVVVFWLRDWIVRLFNLDTATTTTTATTPPPTTTTLIPDYYLYPQSSNIIRYRK